MVHISQMIDSDLVTEEAFNYPENPHSAGQTMFSQQNQSEKTAYFRKDLM